MLQSIEIDNFRSLKHVKVPLRPLTVLVGPNDTGKSAFLAALQYLLNRLDFQSWDHWRHSPQAKISISGTSPEGTGVVVSGQAPLNKQVLESLCPLGFFHLLAQGVPMDSVGHEDSHGFPDIKSNGENVPSLLDYLLRRERKRFFDILEALRRLIPGLDDIEIDATDSSHRRLVMVTENGLRIPGHMASAGVRLLLVFVALAHHPTPPKTILLEEPEAGVHPKRLANVMSLLRDITQAKHGQPAQVVVSTHSPYLLDLVDMAKDQVLVFRRSNDGSRTVEPADGDRLKEFLDEFLLGEVWYNQGEEGLVARGR